MTKRSERERDVEPVGEVSEEAEAPRRRLRTRVVTEAVVAAFSAEAEAAPRGGADDEAEAGA
jgi:hypothetical protein